jgi:hypothetical protein
VCRFDVVASSKPIGTCLTKKDAVLLDRRNSSTREVLAVEVGAFLAERFGEGVRQP